MLESKICFDQNQGKNRDVPNKTFSMMKFLGNRIQGRMGFSSKFTREFFLLGTTQFSTHIILAKTNFRLKARIVFKSQNLRPYQFINFIVEIFLFRFSFLRRSFRLKHFFTRQNRILWGDHDSRPDRRYHTTGTDWGCGMVIIGIRYSEYL